MEKGLKRKREEDYPRITYNAGPRTFDRLFKEESLEEMKNVVRKKLGYSKDVSLQLAQLRDARTVDLEDDDDFEAFCSAARTLPVIVVQVTVPNDTGSETPLSPTTRTPTPVTESPKKKRKKRKHTADEAGEASGKKRKSPGDEQTEPPAEVDAPPPRKKKKKDKAKDANGEKTLEKENAAQKNASKSPDKPEKATLVATKDSSKSTDDATTSNPRANSDVATAAQPPSITGKSKKALKEGRDSIVDTSTANAATSGGDKDAEEPPVKPKRKKERKKPSEKAKEGEGLPQKASEKTKERTKGGKPSNDTEEEQADDERDTPTLEKVTEKPSKVPASEQDAPKQKKGKKKAKEPTPPPAKPTEPSESSSDGSDDNDESSEEETPPAKSSKSKGESKRSSHPGPSTQDRNALDALVEELFRRKALEKQQQQLVDKSVEEVTKPASKVKPAQQKPVEAKDSGSSEQPEPASKRQPKTKKFKPTPAAAKKLKDPEKCHICLRSPNHVRSRCGYVRKAGTQLLRERLAQVQGEECEDPDFKTALIHEIQELIDKKEAKEPLSTKVAASSVSISVPPLSSNPTTGSTAPAAEKQTTKASDAPNKESSVDEPLANTGSKPQAGPTKPTVHTSPQDEGRHSSASDSSDSDETPPLSKQPPAQSNQSITAPLARTSQPRKPPLSLSAKVQPTRVVGHDSDGSSSSEKSPFDAAASLSASLSHLGSAAALDAELDAIIRGPSARIRVAEIASSDSDQNGEENELMEEEPEEEEEVVSRSRHYAGVDSSNEEESDASDDDSGITKPPIVTTSTSHSFSETESPEPSESEDDNIQIERSFHDVNKSASGLEIDRAGDRAVSEALAEDTAVFKLAVEDNGSKESSAESEEERSEESDRPMATRSSKKLPAPSTPLKNSVSRRKDPIEQFETPNRRPTSPIEANFERDVQLQSTPRLMDRMKDRAGRTTPKRPTSSIDKALKLLDSVKEVATATENGLPRRTRSSARLASAASAESFKGTKNTAASAKPTSKAQKPASTASQRPNTRARKAALQMTKEVEESEEEHGEGPAAEGDVALDTWAVLEEASPQEGETSMMDELESMNESVPKMPASSQEPQVNGNEDSENESDDEHEVERVVRQPRPSTHRHSQSFRRLTDIASQGAPFQSQIPTLRPATFEQPKATEDQLFGLNNDSDSSDSDSDDSGSDDDKKSSHIPKTRRAGAATSKR